MSDNKNFMDALARDIKNKKENKPLVDEHVAVEETPIKTEKEPVNGEEKPDSFKTETFTRIEKKKIELSPLKIGVGALALLAIGVVSYFLFFAPKIEMLDFVGKNISEFSSWASQYNIDKNGVALNREYNFEYAKDVIVSQSINAGKKIKENTKITLIISDGADPDENVSFPDIKNMTYDEVKTWVEENKLLKTKITTEYSTTVPENNVISYDLKNVNESNFTRGTNLSIVVSKGEAPAGQVTVEDFTGKTFEEMNNWANNKKIELIKQESYSDTVAIGSIISQSVKGGTAVKTGEKITAIVSKGKAVKIPNLVGYTQTMLEAWSAAPDNKVTVIKKEVYNEAPYGNVIGQSIKPGSAVDQGSVLELTVSLYLPVLQTNSTQWYGKDYQELIAWVDDANYKGANIAAGVWYGFEDYTDQVYSKYGSIMEYNCADGNGNLLVYEGSAGTNACGRPLPLNAKIGMKVSSGKRKGGDETAPEYVPQDNVSTLEKPTIAGTYSNPVNGITIKTSPGAKVDVKNTSNTQIIKNVVEANELGYASVEFNSPVYTSEQIIIYATLGDSTEMYEGTIPQNP